MKNTIAKIQCVRCWRFFASNSAFEKHRTGEFASATRRCMTDEEMGNAGMETEEKNVRIVAEGRDTYGSHPVWFDARGRERLQSLYGSQP